MARDVAFRRQRDRVVWMTGYGANQSGHSLGELGQFGMGEFRIVRMLRHVADEHRMSGNCAQWQIVVRSRGVHVALYGDRWFAGLEIRKIGMLGYIALVQSMSRHVADSVRLLPSQLGVAIFRIVGMANEIADDARMTLGQIHVADGLDLRWRTA